MQVIVMRSNGSQRIGTTEVIQTTEIVEIGQNTKKSPGDLRSFQSLWLLWKLTSPLWCEKLPRSKIIRSMQQLKDSGNTQIRSNKDCLQ